MPNVAQDEIEVTLDRLGAIDDKSQFHENFADAAFDIGQAEIVGREMGKQCRKAGADAVVHIGRKVLTLRDSRFNDFNLGSLADLLQASNKDGCRHHCCSHDDPAKRKRVEKSDVLRAKIGLVVADRYVERDRVRSQEGSDPCDNVEAAASKEPAAFFACHYP